MSPDSTILDRRWGLSALKSAYAEMYPDCKPPFIEEIAKRIEQGVFKKTSSSQDYEKSIRHTANSIIHLAQKTARHNTHNGAPEAVTGGASHLLPKKIDQSSVGENQGRRSKNPGPYSLPDPSDVVNLVPLILEAAVQVLGKIETEQQVRALGDGQKSTIGFLAFEKLSKLINSVGRGLGASSKAARPSLSSSESLYLQPFSGPDSRDVNDLQGRNANCGGNRAPPCMTLAELKANYKEKIEKLLPRIFNYLCWEKNREIEKRNDPHLIQSIAYVRAGLLQDTIRNPDALQSLEILSKRMLDRFGHLFEHQVLYESSEPEESEKLSDEDSLPSQRLIHNHRDSTDDSVDLGETDSYTEDEEDVHPKQWERRGCDAHDLEKDCERGGHGTIDNCLSDENAHQEYSFEEDGLSGDDLKEPNFSDNFLEEILGQKQHTICKVQTNAKEPNDIKEEEGMMTLQSREANRQLELLIESLYAQQAEDLNSFGLEPIPLALNEDVANNQSNVDGSIQEPQKQERISVEGQASPNPRDNADNAVPTVTPRRSTRIRSKAPVSAANDHMSGQNASNLAKTPRSKKETPTNTLQTRKTPRRTPRKTPRK